ncbi:MAG: ABC transporter permease [Chryseolinea sp.]
MSSEKLVTNVFRFLQWICPDHLYEEIEGDLIQKFNRDVKLFGKERAKRRLIWNAVRFFRPGIVMRNKFRIELNQLNMIRNYFKIALRHLIKDKTYSAISVLGLSISLAVCLLIFQYTFYERHFDQFNKHSNHIFRITTQVLEGDQKISESASSSGLLGPAIKENFPEVIQTAQLLSTRYWFDVTLKYEKGINPIVFNEHNLYYADQSFLTIFSFSWKQGQPSSALEKPFSAVLSASVAKRYFGEDDPIGKVLHLKGSFDEHDYTVTGLIDDLPLDSHLDADILLSVSSLEHNTNFSTFDAYTYILFAPGANKENFKSKLDDLVAAYFTNLPNQIPAKTKTKYDLQVITDIHLYSNLDDEIKPGGNALSVYFFLLVAILILFIAWINYINMATARSVSRAKEVGIRIVSGASRAQVINQFLSESVIINMVSAMMAIVLIYFLSPLFHQMTGLQVSFDRLFANGLNRDGIAILSLFCLGVFVSGFYPAKMMSSYNPALVLKGKFLGSKKGNALRKVLVVFQFTCAISLTISVMAFDKQFWFMQNQDLGIDIKKTMILKAPIMIDSTYTTRLVTFKSKLIENSIIRSTSVSSAIPGEKIGWAGSITKENKASDFKFNAAINIVDPDFISSYNLNLIAGRNFVTTDFPIGQFGSKVEPVILNKAAIEKLGFKKSEEALGTFLYWGENKCLVVGVIDDYLQSVKRNLRPILFSAGGGPQLSMKLGKGVNSSNLMQSVTTIRNLWKATFPDSPFDYFFLEDYYASQYSDSKQLNNLFRIFCGLAVVISGLGLFGLSSFTTRQRVKEVSIRKILGAGTINLIGLLTKEFLLLVIMASCFALPLTYFGIGEWLQGFAFHIEMGLWFYILPITMIVLISVFTIASQVIKVVLSNPTDNLKHE